MYVIMLEDKFMRLMTYKPPSSRRLRLPTSASDQVQMTAMDGNTQAHSVSSSADDDMRPLMPVPVSP
jgi:hypothetical protein